MRKSSLSTGQMARYCEVTSATIVNWIHAGRLNAFTTPGGQFRVEVSKFVDFMMANDFPVPPELQAAGNRSILVIEDDEPTLEALAEIAGSLGPRFRVHTARNGFDGLIEVGNHKPDVLALDLSLPHMDGAELVRKIRAKPDTKGMKILVVTGLAPNSELLQSAKAAGVDAVLYKPVMVDDFRGTILRLLSQ